MHKNNTEQRKKNAGTQIGEKQKREQGEERNHSVFLF
jgi:hypothetical protein